MVGAREEGSCPGRRLVRDGGQAQLSQSREDRFLHWLSRDRRPTLKRSTLTGVRTEALPSRGRAAAFASGSDEEASRCTSQIFLRAACLAKPPMGSPFFSGAPKTRDRDKVSC